MIGNRRWWRVALAAVVLAVTGPAWAGERVALVMGNSAYNAGTGWRPLPQAVNDARAVGERLKKAGFQVIEGYDLNRQQMNDKLAALVQATAPPRAPELVLVYYSGHGADFLRSNYLIPIGATLPYEQPTANQLEDLYFPVARKIITNLSGDGERSNIVILDSCRNDPFVKGAGGSGRKGLESAAPFSDMGKPSGTLIVYGAKPGSFSFEGGERDKHSIFTAALLEVWDEHPGLNLTTLFAKAGQRTTRRTQARGIPQEPTTEGTSAVGLVVLSPAPALDTAEDQAWQTAETAATAEAVKRYLAAYPKGRHAEEARGMLKGLERRGEAGSVAPPKVEPAVVTETAEPVAPVRPAEVKPGVAASLQPGQEFKDCDKCPVMVVVPAGEFVMGSPDDEGPDRNNDESPQHKVTIARPFAVGKYEVTFTEWDACVAGGGCQTNKQPRDQGWDRGRRPVINVSWSDAKAYVAWLGKITGKSYRLLTEAEWEYAARAGTTTPYSTGPIITTQQANFSGKETWRDDEAKGNRGQDVEVGSLPANAFGMHEMHGNVAEWVEDCYTGSYITARSDGSEFPPYNCSARVVRGGAWTDDAWLVRSANRLYSPLDYKSFDIGFRIARTF